MGSLADIVDFHMMKPLQGATTPAMAPISLPQTVSQPTQDNSLAGGFAQGLAMVPDKKPAVALNPQPLPPAPPAPLTSDETQKVEVMSGDQPIAHFLDQLGAHEYEYKDPERDGQGKHFSVMAQELEKAGPVGKSMVVNTPEGKKVDYARGLAVYLAAAASLNDRLNKLERLAKRTKKD